MLRHTVVEQDQSETRIVYCAVDIKSWLARTPSVDEVRPARCARCGVAGRPLGSKLGIWGHGLRERQLLGPLEPDGLPQRVDIKVRRYLCRHCKAVMVVVPRGVLPRRYYTGCAIALAMALLGVNGSANPSISDR
ncbi:MAG: hypothetical protein MJE77_29630 [Proteobacteria bacterium]|nr:hypothetical protein [Pseudomonadota bacterium]